MICAGGAAESGPPSPRLSQGMSKNNGRREEKTKVQGGWRQNVSKLVFPEVKHVLSESRRGLMWCHRCCSRVWPGWVSFSLLPPSQVATQNTWRANRPQLFRWQKGRILRTQLDKSSVTHDTCAFIEPLTCEERGEQGKSKHEDLQAGQLKRNYSAQPYGKANSFAATKIKYSYDAKNHSKVSTDYGSRPCHYYIEEGWVSFC